jgi:hypothetical protein
LGDVPTTTEVGTDVLPKSAPPWHKDPSARRRAFRSSTTETSRRSW